MQARNYIAAEAGGASPRLNEVHGQSASSLAGEVDEATARFLNDFLFGRQPLLSLPAHPLIADVVQIVREGDHAAGRRMYDASRRSAEHRVAWAVIGAEGLLHGDDEDMRLAVEILDGLATTDGLPEAAGHLSRAVFALSEDERRTWRQRAEEQWPPAVNPTWVSPAAHYLLHVLAALDEQKDEA